MAYKHKPLSEFVDLLNERVSLSGINSEEDLRFTFLHFLISSGSCEHWEIECEVPLPSYKGNRIDALIYGMYERKLAIEFKYNRESLSTLPKPQLAGNIYADLFRLGESHARLKCDCHFVYITDRSMYDYLNTNSSGCSDLFSLNEGSRLDVSYDVLKGKSKTFIRSLKGFLNPISIDVLVKASLSNGMNLIILSVQHVPDDAYNYD